MMPRIPTPDELRSEFRNGDDRKVNVGPGEVVVPKKVLKDNPALGPAIAQAIAASGGDPRAYKVGSPQGNYNPVSGDQEFFFKAIKNLFKKNPAAAPLATIASSFIPGAPVWLTPAVAGTTTYAATDSVGAGLGAAAGSYLGAQYGAGEKTIGQALDTAATTPGMAGDLAGGVGNFLSEGAVGEAIRSANIGSTIGAMLGTSLGGAVGSMIDPATPDSTSFDPNITPIQSAQLPTGAPQQLALPSSQAPNQVAAAQATPYVPAGVSYLAPTKNRDTGKTEYTNTNAFGSNFRNSRRNSISNVITV